jgi:hypothetical protein
VKNTYISNASTAYGLLTGTPAGTGKMAQTAKPIVVTLDASGVNLYGSHVGAVGATSVGFFWSTATMGTGVGGGTNVPATLSDNFTAALPVASLTAGTTYYYKAWASNNVGTSYGVEKTFVYTVAPAVSALTVANITRAPTSLTIQGTISSVGGGRIIEKGIAYWLTTGGTAVTSATINTFATKAIDLSGSTTTAIVQTITGLVQGSSYTFVAYAINDRSGVVVGTGVSATFPKPPTLNAPESSSKTTSSITVSCTINILGTADQNTGISERGFLWSLTQTSIDGLTSIPDLSGSSDPVTLNNATTTPNVFRVKLATNSPFSATISHSSITFNTTIYVRAYIITATEGNAISSRILVTTNDAVAPTVTTTSITPESLSITFSGNITATGGVNVTERGFVFIPLQSTPQSLLKTTANATILSETIDSPNTGQFALATTTPLLANTRYVYVAYASNSRGTNYGTIQNFTTKANPAIRHDNYISTATQITVYGTITSNGGSTIQGSGIVYSTTNSMPTILDNNITVINNPTTPTINVKWSRIFTVQNASLYYVRTFVTTGISTIYSEVLETKRFSVTPPANTLTALNGGFRLYAFTASSTFTVTGRNIINYFVVGGGGGGGNGGGDRTGGGGGAGGCLYNSSTHFIEGSYTVSVGAGGSAGSDGSSSGISGPTGFSAITANGGGKGGQGSTSASTGGSGGGGRHGQSGANGTSGQGYNGGSGYDGKGTDDAQYAGGGGGGAGGKGDDGTSSGGGSGGSGVQVGIPGWTNSIGVTTFPTNYCGGGGGGFQNRNASSGAGGSGSNGGGNGAKAIGKNGGNATSSADGTNGTEYTGGGGGGCAYTDGGTAGNQTGIKTGGSGGSGVVFISVSTSFI